jgi:hypothetical protein
MSSLGPIFSSSSSLSSNMFGADEQNIELVGNEARQAYLQATDNPQERHAEVGILLPDQQRAIRSSPHEVIIM